MGWGTTSVGILEVGGRLGGEVRTVLGPLNKRRTE